MVGTGSQKMRLTSTLAVQTLLFQDLVSAAFFDFSDKFVRSKSLTLLFAKYLSDLYPSIRLTVNQESYKPSLWPSDVPKNKKESRFPGSYELNHAEDCFFSQSSYLPLCPVALHFT